jgi:hypothetical protein
VYQFFFFGTTRAMSRSLLKLSPNFLAGTHESKTWRLTPIPVRKAQTAVVTSR